MNGTVLHCILSLHVKHRNTLFLLFVVVAASSAAYTHARMNGFMVFFIYFSFATFRYCVRFFGIPPNGLFFFLLFQRFWWYLLRKMSAQPEGTGEKFAMVRNTRFHSFHFQFTFMVVGVMQHPRVDHDRRFPECCVS